MKLLPRHKLIAGTAPNREAPQIISNANFTKCLLKPQFLAALPPFATSLEHELCLFRIVRDGLKNVAKAKRPKIRPK